MLSHGVSQGILRAHPRAEPVLSSRWPPQTELSGNFVDFLSHIGLFGHFFFVFLVFWLYIMISDCIFMRLFVCIYVHVSYAFTF